jgi:hypothetical protein
MWFEIWTHTEKVGKNLLLLAYPLSPLFWHIKFHKPGIKMLATKWKWNENDFKMKKFQSWNVGCAAFAERFWFDRNFTNFLVWKLTNFDEWKYASLLWEMNSYNHCFSHPKVYISTSAGGIADFFRVWNVAFITEI